MQFYKYEHIVVKFMYEFFGCDYCVLLYITYYIRNLVDITTIQQFIRFYD